MTNLVTLAPETSAQNEQATLLEMMRLRRIHGYGIAKAWSLDSLRTKVADRMTRFLREESPINMEARKLAPKCVLDLTLDNDEAICASEHELLLSIMKQKKMHGHGIAFNWRLPTLRQMVAEQLKCFLPDPRSRRLAPVSKLDGYQVGDLLTCQVKSKRQDRVIVSFDGTVGEIPIDQICGTNGATSKTYLAGLSKGDRIEAELIGIETTPIKSKLRRFTLSRKTVVDRLVLDELQSGRQNRPGMHVIGRVKRLPNQTRALVEITDGPAAGYQANLNADQVPGDSPAQRLAYMSNLSVGDQIIGEVIRKQDAKDRSSKVQIQISTDNLWRERLQTVIQDKIPVVCRFDKKTPNGMSVWITEGPLARFRGIVSWSEMVGTSRQDRISLANNLKEGNKVRAVIKGIGLDHTGETVAMMSIVAHEFPTGKIITCRGFKLTENGLFAVDQATNQIVCLPMTKTQGHKLGQRRRRQELLASNKSFKAEVIDTQKSDRGRCLIVSEERFDPIRVVASLKAGNLTKAGDKVKGEVVRVVKDQEFMLVKLASNLATDVIAILRARQLPGHSRKDCMRILKSYQPGDHLEAEVIRTSHKGKRGYSIDLSMIAAEERAKMAETLRKVATMSSARGKQLTDFLGSAMIKSRY